MGLGLSGGLRAGQLGLQAGEGGWRALARLCRALRPEVLTQLTTDAEKLLGGGAKGFRDGDAEKICPGLGMPGRVGHS